MLRAAVAGAGLQSLFDEVLSVEDVGVFKPDPRVYGLAAERLGLSPGRISFQSSNAWDVAGASVYGFRVAWVNRFRQVPERLPRAADAELETLSGLPPLLGL